MRRAKYSYESAYDAETGLPSFTYCEYGTVDPFRDIEKRIDRFNETYAKRTGLTVDVKNGRAGWK